MYKIIIIMFLINPTADNVLNIEKKDGKVLEFRTLEQCYEHIYDNLGALRAFAFSQFGPNTPIKVIDCIRKRTQV